MFTVLGREVDRRLTAEAGADSQARIKLRIGSKSWIGMAPGESSEQRFSAVTGTFPSKVWQETAEWGNGASCGTWKMGST